MGGRPPLKKSLFPVQRVAEIVASWAAANLSSFLRVSFFLGGGGGRGGKKIMKFLRIFFWQNEKKKGFPFCSNILTRPETTFLLRMA